MKTGLGRPIARLSHVQPGRRGPQASRRGSTAIPLPWHPGGDIPLLAMARLRRRPPTLAP